MTWLRVEITNRDSEGRESTTDDYIIMERSFIMLIDWSPTVIDRLVRPSGRRGFCSRQFPADNG